MICSFLNNWLGGMFKKAAVAALATGAALTSAPALAQSADNLDWYIFVGRNANDNPIVVYFQSDSSSPDFEPTGSVAMILNPDYAPSGSFDPTQACVATSLDFDPADAKTLRVRHIYGPNSDQKTVSVIDFPSYMAQQTAVTLLQEGVLIDEKATAPYFSCAGFVWSQLISQPQEVWEELILKEIERMRAEKKNN